MTNPTREQIEQIEQTTGRDLNQIVELTCFGNDLSANGSDDLLESCFLELFVRVETPPVDREWIISHCTCDESPRHTIWRCREGQPWQDKIEAWRAEPRDFIGDGNMERVLVDELANRGWYVERIRHNDVHRACVTKSGEPLFCILADDIATALCRAAGLACRKSEGE